VQYTVITNHALGGIRTRDLSNQAAADLCLRRHGHRGSAVHNSRQIRHWHSFKNSVNKFESADKQQVNKQSGDPKSDSPEAVS
jgi:hypothetical protein